MLFPLAVSQPGQTHASRQIPLESSSNPGSRSRPSQDNQSASLLQPLFATTSGRDARERSQASSSAGRRALEREEEDSLTLATSRRPSKKMAKETTLCQYQDARSRSRRPRSHSLRRSRSKVRRNSISSQKTQRVLQLQSPLTSTRAPSSEPEEERSSRAAEAEYDQIVMSWDMTMLARQKLLAMKDVLTRLAQQTAGTALSNETLTAVRNGESELAATAEELERIATEQSAMLLADDSDDEALFDEENEERRPSLVQRVRAYIPSYATTKSILAQGFLIGICLHLVQHYTRFPVLDVIQSLVIALYAWIKAFIQ